MIRNEHSCIMRTISGRSTTKKLIKNCIICFKYSPIFINVKMDNLPKKRTEVCLPFSHVGVDDCGSFFIKNGSRRTKTSAKTYISIFAYFSMKAVNLELVDDLKSESFINALKRFISRSGKSLEIKSVIVK